MNSKEFEKKHGFHPSEMFGNTAIKSSGGAKNHPKAKKGAMVSIRSKNHLKSKYEDLSEDQHQENLIKWLKVKKIHFEASINGMYLPNPHKPGTRAYLLQKRVNQSVLAKHKRLGYEKGIADVKVYFPNIELNIELKKIGGKPTPEQLKTKELYKNFMYANYEIIEGFKDAIAYIEKFL